MRIVLDIGRLAIAVCLYAYALHLGSWLSFPVAAIGLVIQVGGYAYVKENFS